MLFLSNIKEKIIDAVFFSDFNSNLMNKKMIILHKALMIKIICIGCYKKVYLITLYEQNIIAESFPNLKYSYQEQNLVK